MPIKPEFPNKRRNVGGSGGPVPTSGEGLCPGVTKTTAQSLRLQHLRKGLG